MLFSVDYGIATDAIDPTLRTKESTVMKQAMRSQLMIENLGEELRVLYVAMTRAREKLYLTGAKDHLFDYLEKKIHETDKTARSYSQLTMAGSFLDWITAAACKHKSFKAIYEQLGINVPFDGVCYKDESPLSVLLVTKSSLSMQTSLWRAEEAIKRTALENWKTKTSIKAAGGIYRIGIKDTPRGGSLCSEWIRHKRACCTAYKARTKTARSRVLRAFARRRTLARVFAAKR